MDKLNIAVCLRGHRRTYTQAFSYIKELESNHNIDVFIDTWEDYGLLNLTTESSITTPGTVDLNSGLIDLKAVINTYNPKVLKVDHYQNFHHLFESQASKFSDWYEEVKHDPTVGVPRMHSFISQFYKKASVINNAIKFAKDNNKSYDVYIVTRPDVLLNIDDTIFKSVRDSVNSVWVRSIVETIKQTKANWTCDLFFVGTSSSIKTLATIYDSIESIRSDLYSEWKSTQDKSTYARMFCIHQLCWYYLNSKGISIKQDSKLSATITGRKKYT